MRSNLLIALACAIPSAATAQDIVVRDGREEFRMVEYLGGDATQPKNRVGWLVLSDTTLALYECKREYCLANKSNDNYKPQPYYVIPLAGIKDVSSSSSVRGPGLGSKLALGLLAGDKTEEMVGVIYESSTSAEAPIFKTPKALSAAIEAKIRFRMKKMGHPLKESS